MPEVDLFGDNNVPKGTELYDARIGKIQAEIHNYLRQGVVPGAIQQILTKLDNISIDADTVNLNTDQLEAKLDTLNGLITTLQADTALLKNDVANGTFENRLVNEGSSFSYGGPGNHGAFDCGADADYVIFTLTGGGGGYTHNIELSTTSNFSSFVSTSGSQVTVYNERIVSSNLDTHAFKYSNTNLQSGSAGIYVLSLNREHVKYRFARVTITGGGGGGWTGKFVSLRSNLPSLGVNFPFHRLPVHGVVDLNTVLNAVPITDNSGSITVDGTVTANAGTGSFTVAQSTHANLKAQAQILDSSGNQLQYITSGTAGSPSAMVLSVQGVASGTAVPVTINSGNVYVDGGYLEGGYLDAVNSLRDGDGSVFGIDRNFPVEGAVTACSDRGGISQAGTQSITTGGTNQIVFNENVNRRFLFVQNISDTAMYLGLGFAPSNTTPQGILLEANGGSVVFDSNYIPNSEVRIVCATSGKRFVALQNN